MCPNCRAFITTDDRVCPYCGERVGPRAIDVQQPREILGGLIPHAHFTTILILIINVALFIATQWFARTIGESNALGIFGAMYGPLVWREHEWWRLITAGFLHGGILHIAMNSWVLYDLGAQVEQVYGTPRFLALYFAGTVAGFYVSARMHPLSGFSVGSSAGIMGLIGAMIAFGVANRSSVGRAISSFYTRWVVYILAFGLLPGFRVDNWAHIGGLLAGFAIGYLAGTPMRSSYARESMWRVIATGAVLLTLYAFWLMYRSFPVAHQRAERPIMGPSQSQSSLPISTRSLAAYVGHAGSQNLSAQELMAGRQRPEPDGLSPLRTGPDDRTHLPADPCPHCLGIPPIA